MRRKLFCIFAVLAVLALAMSPLSAEAAAVQREAACELSYELCMLGVDESVEAWACADSYQICVGGSSIGPGCSYCRADAKERPVLLDGNTVPTILFVECEIRLFAGDGSELALEIIDVSKITKSQCLRACLEHGLLAGCPDRDEFERIFSECSSGHCPSSGGHRVGTICQPL